MGNRRVIVTVLHVDPAFPDSDSSVTYTIDQGFNVLQERDVHKDETTGLLVPGQTKITITGILSESPKIQLTVPDDIAPFFEQSGCFTRG